MNVNRYFLNGDATVAIGRNNIATNEDIPPGFHEISENEFLDFQAEIHAKGQAAQAARAEQYVAQKLEGLVEAGIPEAAARMLLGVDS